MTLNRPVEILIYLYDINFETVKVTELGDKDLKNRYIAVTCSPLLPLFWRWLVNFRDKLNQNSDILIYHCADGKRITNLLTRQESTTQLQQLTFLNWKKWSNAKMA